VVSTHLDGLGAGGIDPLDARVGREPLGDGGDDLANVLEGVHRNA
jgi:hypothetical protein